MTNVRVDWEQKLIEIGDPAADVEQTPDIHSLPKPKLGTPVGHCIYCVIKKEYPICEECIEDEVYSNITGECSACHKPEPEGVKPFQKCGKCKFIKYCSKECQRKDWKYHRVVCKTFGKHYESIQTWHTSEKAKMRESKERAKREGVRPDSIFNI